MRISFYTVMFTGRILISAGFFINSEFVLAENPDSTLVKINRRSEYFENAARLFEIDCHVLKAIVYVERRMNVDWSDEALDEIFAASGLNSSIGFCQVKMKTAYWIEVQLNDTASGFYPGEKYSGILPLSHSPHQIITKLNNDSLNILYAAAYLCIIQKHWENSGYPLYDKPEITGTLYSTGLFYPNGKERKPRHNPQANAFGLQVARYMLDYKK